MEKEEIKKSMAYIESNFIEGNNIYVYDGANPAFIFYKEKLTSKEIRDADIVLASRHRDNWSAYQNLILSMNEPVWVLFSHVWTHENEDNIKEDKYILGAFRKNGYIIIDEKKYKNSSVHYAVKPVK